MDLIFWRHAEAEEPTAGMADLDRRLTAKGRRQARQVGAWLKLRLPEDCRVLASPARRTCETVAALGRPFEIEPGIAPTATAGDVLAAAARNGGARAVLLVGHQPCLGEAIRYLLLGGDERVREGGLSVRKGAVWWLRCAGDDVGPGARATVRAVIGPEFVA
ncbi:MAG: histidine phosphatase family protein [Rhodocyclaceae bacterium]|nr:histidine phosphatase family protein [Rhodocyclaceae bacterium]